jgi:hypothetical protein
MRDANDMGYECLILSDCTGATDPNNHLAALEMVKKQVSSCRAAAGLHWQPIANHLPAAGSPVSPSGCLPSWPMAALLHADMHLLPWLLMRRVACLVRCLTQPP